MIESSATEQDRIVSPIVDSEPQFENKLRPKHLNEYIGQDLIKKTLLVSIEAAKKRQQALDHVLLHGAPGLGKTTLANIIANEIGSNIKVTSGPALEKPGDVAAILSNLEENDVLFIDEIHRLKTVVEEMLYTAMEDFAIDIVIGKGPAARSMRINLPQFTLIGATTKLSMLSSPLRDRFGNVFKLQAYSNDDIQEIITRSANILRTEIDSPIAERLSQACRHTPRIANRLLKRVRDFADVYNDSVIDQDILDKTFDALGVDLLGLDQVDRGILDLIINKFSGGPVGLGTLSAAINEEEATLEDIYEPFLIQLGMLDRTPRGRVVTPLAYQHLGIISQDGKSNK